MTIFYIFTQDAPVAWSLSSDLPSCSVPWNKLKCLHVDDKGLVLGDNQGNGNKEKTFLKSVFFIYLTVLY